MTTYLWYLLQLLNGLCPTIPTKNAHESPILGQPELFLDHTALLRPV